MSRKKYNYIENDNDEIVSDDILETEIEDTENDISEVDISDNIEETVAKDNIVSCKIIKRLSNDKAIINVNGCGLIVPVKDNSDSVNIKFVGAIGSPDFKYEVV